MAKTGDIVRFLNTVGGGRITKIKDNIAYVEDEDGFEIPVLIKECVVVGTAPVQPVPPASHTAVAAKKTPPALKATASTASTPAPAPVIEEELPVVETPEGENINLVLAYEPSNIKELSTTVFDTYLVNDSNYFMYFSYMTRADEEQQWTTRYAGIVEPNIQLFIGETTHDDLGRMDHLAVQYIAFKRDKGFTLKQPQLIDIKLDTTKFFRLHCFTDNIYFDSKVIAVDLVSNDRPFRPITIDEKKIEKAIKAKKAVDSPRRRIVKKRPKAEKKAENTIVVDLHINELVDNIRGLSNADMLNLQVDEFSRIMDENLKNKGQKIVFIHGKGEGVLRNAILKELNHRYKGHDVQDASFREYGFGATQVTIR